MSENQNIKKNSGPNNFQFILIVSGLLILALIANFRVSTLESLVFKLHDSQQEQINEIKNLRKWISLEDEIDAYIKHIYPDGEILLTDLTDMKGANIGNIIISFTNGTNATVNGEEFVIKAFQYSLESKKKEDK